MTTKPIPTSDGTLPVALDRLLVTIFPGATVPSAQQGIHSEQVRDILALLPNSVVYDALKNILAQGSNVTFVEDDDALTITISGSAAGLTSITFPAWQQRTAYAARTAVWHSGAVYAAKQDIDNQQVTGPDADTANWETLTLYRGPFDTSAYYHEGQQATDSGELYAAKSAQNPNSTTPADNSSGWYRVSAPDALTGAGIVTLLETLSGNARLNASAIRDLPQPGDGGLASVSSDATLTGNGTSGSPLAVANPFTAANETKLAGIEAGAEANVGEEYTQAEKTKLAGIEAGANEAASWARENSPSGTIPNARVPGTIARVNATLALVGGTMTGPIVLPGAPTADLQAATKAYVDAAVAAVTPSMPSTVDFLFAATDGTGLSPLTDLPPGGGQSSANGEVTIAAYSGSRYWHIVRPTADGDISSVRVKGSQIEQIGAFTRGAEPFTYRGTQYRSWRSNHALTNATATTIVVR